MEMQLPNGYTLIRTDELHTIKSLADRYIKFKPVYFRYNKALNKLFKIADLICAPLKGGQDDSKATVVAPKEPGCSNRDNSVSLGVREGSTNTSNTGDMPTDTRGQGRTDNTENC